MKKSILVFVWVLLNTSFLSFAHVNTTTAETIVSHSRPQNHKIVSNEINCLEGSYTGTWNGSTIMLEIVDARYNNMLSFRGSVSGYVKYKNKVYPVKGTLRYRTNEHKYEVYIDMIEYDAKNKISFDFNGNITCYQGGAGIFDGAIITPGYGHSEMHDIILRKDVKR